MFRITILAARRVLPPDLITPAKASYPFMNDRGPEATPPPDNVSTEERRGDRFVPVPDPHLKSIPSVLASVRMLSRLSCTALMKQADTCGWRYASSSFFTPPVAGSQYQPLPLELRWYLCHRPQLNHTGELNAAFWRTRI